MTIRDLKQIDSVLSVLRRKYGNMAEFDEISRLSRRGIISLDEALEKISEYEANYGGRIATEYEQRRRSNNR